jgi:hypothetical protein
MDKLSSLLQAFVNYGRKKFYIILHRDPSYKDFYAPNFQHGFSQS